MRGAIAGGSRQAVEAGAWALREGGTAVDAAIAAVLGAFVVEGPLTGPAGGGFCLVDRPGEEPVLLDGFFAVPRGARSAMDEVVIDFADASTQVFHVGESSVAVPGLLPCLVEAHARHGRLPWATLFTPAVELAGRGIEVSPAQAFLHEILRPILVREEGGRRVYGRPGFVDTADLVPALLLLRRGGAEAVVELLPDLGEDLARYRVAEREPLETAFVGARVLTTPAPSIGGGVVARGLAELAGAAEASPGSVDEALQLVAALSVGYAVPASGAKPTGTTHVAAIDGDGAVASLSSTLGSGSGVFRQGFQLNNMLGELDVIGAGEHLAGERLPSMMSPTLALVDDQPRLALGSAGSVRLAGAIVQAVEGVVRQGLAVTEAIDRPRLHVDGGTVHVEGGWSDDVGDALAAAGWQVVTWADRNLYFGGVSGVEVRPSGSPGAAGDPRRGGHGLVVP
jgi:gamma-glutamyltranspeptidase/glutathione hydrolase